MMMTDRTTKLLLFCIALALWGLLLRPAFTPITASAQGSGDGQLVVVGSGRQAPGIFLFTQIGQGVYRFSPNDLSVIAHAHFDATKDTFVNQTP
jgi:hypothetical protein